MPARLKDPKRRKRQNRASTRAILPPEDVGREVPPLPPRLGAVEWPLRVPPGQYLDRYPNGPNAELARRVLDQRSDWHPLVVRVWESMWRSPQRVRYLEADKTEMYALLALWQDFAESESASERIRLSAEIRLQGQRFGRSPLDRMRLEWQVAETEEKQEKRQRKREKGTKRPDPAKDPREQIKAMS